MGGTFASVDLVALKEAELRAEAEAKQRLAGDDKSAYVLASTLWRGRWASYKRFKTWLLKNPQVRNAQRGKRQPETLRRITSSLKAC